MGHWVWAIPGGVIALETLVLSWFLLTWYFPERKQASAADTRRLVRPGRGHAA